MERIGQHTPARQKKNIQKEYLQEGGDGVDAGAGWVQPGGGGPHAEQAAHPLARGRPHRAQGLEDEDIADQEQGKARISPTLISSWIHRSFAGELKPA